MEEDKKVSDCTVEFDINEEGNALSVEVITNDGSRMLMKQALSSLIAIYCKVAEDAGEEPISYFLEEMGIPHNIQYVDGGLQ